MIQGNEKGDIKVKGNKNKIIFCIIILLAVCVVLFVVVKNGWFGQNADKPIESKNSSMSSESLSSESTSEESSLKNETSSESFDSFKSTEYISIYVPDEEGFVLYKVKNMPTDLQNLIAQAVSLGGLSEGAELVNVNYKEGDSGIDRYSVSYAEIIISGEIEDTASDFNMLSAITATLSEFYPMAGEIKLVSDNNELIFPGKNLSSVAITNITKTIEMDYSE